LGEFNFQVQQWDSLSLSAERDVYSDERARKDLAPLGAKPVSGTIAGASEAIALLWSQGVKKESPGYKHLAPLGAKRRSDILLHFKFEFALQCGSRKAEL
jgi:hypothetical protein